jgi:predicted HNH restriction endonuclease
MPLKFWKFQYAGHAQVQRCMRTRSLPPDQDFPPLKNTYAHPARSLKPDDGVLLAQLEGDKAKVFAVGRVRTIQPTVIDWALVTQTFSPNRRLGLTNWQQKSAFEISLNPSKRYGLQTLLDRHVVEAEHYESGSDEAVEGYLRERKLLGSIRNATLARRRQERDNHTCQACQLRLQVNEQFVSEVHHLEPLNATGPTLTTIDSLVSLCPTCHRIAHLRNPPYEVHDIRGFRGFHTTDA